MPLARYFLCVGGVLLALLFVIGAELPKLPAEQVAANTAADLPMIRIHTDRKWPERVVFDTSIPAGVGPVATTGDAKTDIATKANIAKTGTGAPVLIKVSDGAAPDVLAKVRVREAFAQFQPTEPKQLQPIDPKKPELKRPVKRKVARRHTAPSTMLVAQQPPFGFFAKNIW